MASFNTAYSTGENHYSASLAAGKKYVFRVARATAGVPANELTWSAWSDELLATTVAAEASSTTHTDVNGITGSVGIVAGDNINVTTSGQNITISGTQGGIVWGTPPDFPTDPGSAGDAAYDSNFFYLHNGAEWKRAALQQWAPALTVSQSPSSQSVVEGEDAIFTAVVLADRGLSPTFQWQRSTDSGSSWADISGANNQSHTESNVSLSDSGNRFRLVASDANASSVTTDAAELTVGVSLRLLAEDGSPLDAEDGTNIRRDGGVILFSQSPASVTTNVTEGDAVVFSAQASLYGATGSISYQWYYVEGGVETQITQVDFWPQTPTAATYVRKVQSCDDARQFFVRATSAVAPLADSDSATLANVVIEHGLENVSTNDALIGGIDVWSITVSGVPSSEYWYNIQHADVSPYSPPQESDWQDAFSDYVQAQPDENGTITISETASRVEGQVGYGGDGHYRLAIYRRVPPSGSCVQKFSGTFYSNYATVYPENT